MAALWGTGDTHFYHWNIGRPDYCNRPDDWQELIVARWNEVVQPEDWVLHVGDIAFGRDATLERIVEIRKRLNGRILLIWGNHDRIFSRRQWLEEVGVEVVLRQHGEKYDLGQYRVVCLYKEPHACKRAWKKTFLYASHRPIPAQRATPYYYGHIHNNEEPTQYPGRCLCVEVNDYRPVRIGDIAA